MTISKTIPLVRTGIKPTNYVSPWEIETKAKLEAYDFKACVKRFFELLDKVETSDNDVEFRPNYISSCRALDGAELGWLIEKIKKEIE